MILEQRLENKIYKCMVRREVLTVKDMSSSLQYGSTTVIYDISNLYFVLQIS